VATSRRSRVRPGKYIGSGFVLKMGWRHRRRPNADAIFRLGGVEGTKKREPGRVARVPHFDLQIDDGLESVLDGLVALASEGRVDSRCALTDVVSRWEWHARRRWEEVRKVTADEVIARTAVDVIGVGPAKQHVGAPLPEHGVVAEPSDDLVISTSSVTLVVALGEGEEVVSGTAMDDVVTGTGENLVITGTSVNPIVPPDGVGIAEECEVVTKDPVVAGTPVDDIVTAAAGHEIVSTQRSNHVVPVAPDDHVEAVGADQDVVAVRAQNQVASFEHRVFEVDAETGRDMLIPQGRRSSR